MKTVAASLVFMLLALTVLSRAANCFTSPSQEASPPPTSQVTLVEIPQPDLSAVEAPVQKDVRGAQAALAATLAQPNSSNPQKADAFGSLGQIYQAYGFDDAALAAYENAAALQPQSFRWQYYAGYLQQRKGDTDSALQSYRRAQTLEPQNTTVLLRLGNLEIAAGHPDLAKAWLLKSMAQPNPSAAAALLGLGKISLAERQYTDALKYFNDALAREPSASSIHYQLAMTYRAMGDMQQMQNELQARGEAEPTIKDPLLEELDALKQGKVGLLERATKAMHEGRFADAATAYRSMTRLNPSDAIAYRYLGVSLEKAGQPEEALQAYEQALRLDPQNATAHYSIGLLLIEMGKEEAAIAHLEGAIRLDPGLVAPHFQLANVLMRAGKGEAAAREYGIVASREPQNSFPRLMQAMAVIHDGSYARGRLLLDQAATAFPDDPDIANALARLLAAAPDPAVRNPARALRLIEPLVQSQRGDGFEEGITLAMALAAAGQFDQAVAFQRAIIQQLENSQRFDLAKLLRPNLDLYEHEKPCRQPWAPDDPIFSPVSGKIQLASE